jgi:DNA-binding transcriptional LysR family regulator
VLRRFSREHPAVELSLRIDRSLQLLAALHAGEADIALAVRRDDPLVGETLVETPMVWIGRDGESLDEAALVSLVLFEAPCTFRQVAIDALAAAGRSYRIGFTSPSLLGLRSAILGGLGVTVRTRFLLGQGLAPLGGLPPLPPIAFALYLRKDIAPWPARDDFIELCRRAFGG